MNDFLPPNEEELEVMIKDIEAQILEAESPAEQRELQYQLDELLEQQRQLIIENNAL